MKKILVILLLAVMILPMGLTAMAEENKPFAGLEFSILSTTWSPYTTENTLIPYIEEATGAKINVEWALKTDFDTRVNTVLAGNDIPDVIMGASFLPLLDQSAIIPLDDYLTPENAPNILAALNENDYVELRNVSDGLIYQLPSVFDFPELNSWMIRTDWLRDMGKDSLNTWEDWLEYWRYIRDNDVNGNGDATDELPIACNYKNFRTAFIPTASTTHYFCVTKDNEYTVIYETPEFKSYLESLRGLYAEGILRSENITTSNFKTVASASQGGTMQTAAEWAMQITDALRENDPDATFGCVPPITTPMGDQAINARAKVSTRGVLTVAAEDRAKEIVALFDWLYSKEGADLINYGVENVHHQVIDGKKKLVSPYIDSFVNARAAGLIFQPFPFLWYADSYMQILLNGKTYEELGDTQKIFYDGLFMNDPYFVKAAPLLTTAAYAEYNSDIANTLSEAEANCITGEITLDEFWQIYESTKENGMSEIIEQAAEAWKLVNGN